jgi:formylglycine-generating enzyme required for sulfatase activity
MISLRDKVSLTMTSAKQAQWEASKPPFEDMVWIPGGTFLMGSDKHYPEEAPVHEVTVDGFWMDRHTVTNEEFRPKLAVDRTRLAYERTLMA